MRRLLALTSVNFNMRKVVIVVVGVFGLGVVVGGLIQKEAPGAAAAEGGGAGAEGVASATTACGDVNGNGTVDISDPIYLLNWLFSGGENPRCRTGPLPATGQTNCYDNAVPPKTDPLPVCPPPCQPFGGQDGFYQAGCPSAGRFVDNGDGTVSDTCTGLMWAKRMARPAANFSPAPDGSGRVDWEKALDYCCDLGKQAGVDVGDADNPPFDGAGHDDWRLPNVRELLSIIHYGRLVPGDSLQRNKPAVDPVFAIPDLELITPTLPYGEFWTSTTASWGPGAAMVVGLSYGHSGWIYRYDPLDPATPPDWLGVMKEYRFWVLPVRTIGQQE